jgi:hypothetical protein
MSLSRGRARTADPSTPNGTSRPLLWFDSRHIERLFRAWVRRMLLGEDLLTGAIVDTLISWRHSGFSIPPRFRLTNRPAD